MVNTRVNGEKNGKKRTEIRKWGIRTCFQFKQVEINLTLLLLSFLKFLSKMVEILFT